MILISLLMGCVYLQSVSLTQLPVERENVVQASADSPLQFFGIGFTKTLFLDEVIATLRKQCPGGRVEGVPSKHERIDYLPGIYRYRVSARGFCNP